MEEVKKLLVYLHGFGLDKTENLGFQNKLAKELNAYLLSIDAPFPSGRERGGFAWWDVKRNTVTNEPEPIYDKKVLESEKYVQNIILKEIEKRNLSWNDVILCGRSQGASLSLIIGLKNEKPCSAIISIAGPVSNKFLNKNNIKSNPKIIWVEKKNDTLLPEYMKKSYSKLKDFGVKFDILIDQESDHDILNESIVEIIKKELN